MIEKVEIVKYQNCDMCNSSGYKNYYNLASAFSKKKLVVCKKCAIREYYGSNGTNTRKYKRENKEGRIFGKPILSY
tara:strand:+ start:1027 stop:1254 length:228 start_codon:yes stop_codon:yes gene_type:complete